jgi:hypothetical protein
MQAKPVSRTAVGMSVLVATGAFASTPPTQTVVPKLPVPSGAEQAKVAAPVMDSAVIIDEAISTIREQACVMRGQRSAHAAELNTYVCPEMAKLIVWD